VLRWGVSAWQQGKPLKGEPHTWQRDETSPQGSAGSKPSRAWETLRTELRWALGSSLSRWIRGAEVAIGEEIPRKVHASCETSAGPDRPRTLKSKPSSWEDEPVLFAKRGTASVGNRKSPPETARLKREKANLIGLYLWRS